MNKEKLYNFALETDNTVLVNALKYASENGLSWEHTKDIVIEMLVNENEALRNQLYEALNDYDD